MQFVILVLCVIVCAYAQVSIPPGYETKYPNYYKFSKHARYARDVTWDKKVGNGKIFGTLGDNDQGLFGKAGYKKEVFNDHRGKLEAQAYGTRVLGANGDNSNLGGRFDWTDKDAKAAVDLSKQIGGRTSLTATGEGLWKFDKNTELSAGGVLRQDIGHGKPDIGVQAQFEHRW